MNYTSSSTFNCGTVNQCESPIGRTLKCSFASIEMCRSNSLSLAGNEEILKVIDPVSALSRLDEIWNGLYNF